MEQVAKRNLTIELNAAKQEHLSKTQCPVFVSTANITILGRQICY